MGEGTENQQMARQASPAAMAAAGLATDSQGQANAGDQPGTGQNNASGSSDQSSSSQTADTQTQTPPPADLSPAKGSEDKSGTPGQAHARHSQSEGGKGIQVKLTQEQIDRLIKEGTLEMTDDTYSGAVRERINQLTARAKTAEKKLGEISSAQEEAERKSLEEQARYKELYEKERQGREAESTARKNDAVRSRFLLAAQSKGIVDPDVAFVVAKSLPGFAMVSVDDEGKVSGIDELVEMLVKDKPYLIPSPQSQKAQSVGAASNPAPQTPPAPKTLAEAGDRLEQALRTGVS